MLSKALRKKEIAKRIRDAREAAGLSQLQVAKTLGITYQAISNYELGKNSIEADMLYKLCKIYGVDPLQIISFGIYTCPICGLLYDSSLESEIKEHDRIHKQFLEAKELYGFFYQPNDWQRMKQESWDTLDFEQSVEMKVSAAKQLMKVYFCRSIYSNNFDNRHPLFPQYASMLLNQEYFKNRFGEESYKVLVSEYGTSPGIPNGRTTYRIDEYVSELRRSKTKNSTPKESVDELSDLERKLLNDFRLLNKQGKEIVMQTLDMAVRLYSGDEDNSSCLENVD